MAIVTIGERQALDVIARAAEMLVLLRDDSKDAALRAGANRLLNDMIPHLERRRRDIYVDELLAKHRPAPRG